MSTFIETPRCNFKKREEDSARPPGVPPGDHSGQDGAEVMGPDSDEEIDDCVFINQLYVLLEVLCFPIQEAWTGKTNPSGFLITFRSYRGGH